MLSQAATKAPGKSRLSTLATQISGFLKLGKVPDKVMWKMDFGSSLGDCMHTYVIWTHLLCFYYLNRQRGLGYMYMRWKLSAIIIVLGLYWIFVVISRVWSSVFHWYLDKEDIPLIWCIHDVSHTHQRCLHTKNLNTILQKKGNELKYLMHTWCLYNL